MEKQIGIQMEQRKGRRLVLFPLPLQGHINPMLQLADILHSKGFSITIIHTNFNSPNPSLHPNFTFRSIADGLLESEASTSDVVLLLKLLNAKCVEPFRDCLLKLLSDVSEEPVSCLISDAVFYFTQAVADSLNLPRIVLRTGGLSSFIIFAAFPLLRERGYIPIQGMFRCISFLYLHFHFLWLKYMYIFEKFHLPPLIFYRFYNHTVKL